MSLTTTNNLTSTPTFDDIRLKMNELLPYAKLNQFNSEDLNACIVNLFKAQKKRPARGFSKFDSTTENKKLSLDIKRATKQTEEYAFALEISKKLELVCENCKINDMDDPEIDELILPRYTTLIEEAKKNSNSLSSADAVELNGKYSDGYTFTKLSKAIIVTALTYVTQLLKLDFTVSIYELWNGDHEVLAADNADAAIDAFKTLLCKFQLKGAKKAFYVKTLRLPPSDWQNIFTLVNSGTSLYSFSHNAGTVSIMWQNKLQQTPSTDIILKLITEQHQKMHTRGVDDNQVPDSDTDTDQQIEEMKQDQPNPPLFHDQSLPGLSSTIPEETSPQDQSVDETLQAESLVTQSLVQVPGVESFIQRGRN